MEGNLYIFSEVCGVVILFSAVLQLEN